MDLEIDKKKKFQIINEEGSLRNPKNLLRKREREKVKGDNKREEEQRIFLVENK